MNHLCDRNGTPVAFALVGERTTLHLQDGSLIAEMSHGGVFDGNGNFLGWYDVNGVYDPAGRRVLAPNKGRAVRVNGTRPQRQRFAPGAVGDHRMRQTIPIKPELSLEWSPTAGEWFSRAFGQHRGGLSAATGVEQTAVAG
ncbi:MAG TPA: hypothetical protein ENK23_02865 [Sorangium sp.]|nr:hypothetical protein [Sorangium sp.]